MADVPNQHHWLAGEPMNAARMNEIATTIDWLRNPPMVHVGRTLTNQALTGTNATNVVSFDTLFNSYDPYDMWDPAAPTKLTCTVPGWYDVGFAAIVSVDANNARVITEITKNSIVQTDALTRFDAISLPNSGNIGVRTNSLLFLNVGDFISLLVIFTSATARNLLASSNSESPRLQLRWVSN